MANNLLESSQTQATTAPSYYTDYLSNLANKGKAAVDPTTGAQFIGINELQKKAFDTAESTTDDYTTQLANAGTTLGNVGSATSPLSAATGYLTDATSNPALAAQQYMNPYITSVVNSLGEAGQRNIRQNLAPGAVAGAIGGGQFGSKRGAEVLGQTLTNANRDILNAQNTALSSGYKDALSAAVQQNQIAGQAGSTAANAASAGQQNLTNLGTAQSNLAGQDQALALARLNALSTLGAQKQTIEQNKELFPLQNLTTLSGLLRGYTTPTTTKTTAEMSPLSGLATVGSGLAGLMQTNANGTNLLQSLTGQSSIPGLAKSVGSWFTPSTTGTDAGLKYGTDYATQGGTADNTLNYSATSPTGWVNNSGQVVDGNGAVIGQDAGNIGGTVYNPDQNVDMYGNVLTSGNPP